MQLIDKLLAVPIIIANNIDSYGCWLGVLRFLDPPSFQFWF